MPAYTVSLPMSLRLSGAKNTVIMNCMYSTEARVKVIGNIKPLTQASQKFDVGLYELQSSIEDTAKEHI